MRRQEESTSKIDYESIIKDRLVKVRQAMIAEAHQTVEYWLTQAVGLAFQHYPALIPEALAERGQWYYKHGKRFENVPNTFSNRKKYYIAAAGDFKLLIEKTEDRSQKIKAYHARAKAYAAASRINHQVIAECQDEAYLKNAISDYVQCLGLSFNPMVATELKLLLQENEGKEYYLTESLEHVDIEISTKLSQLDPYFQVGNEPQEDDYLVRENYTKQEKTQCNLPNSISDIIQIEPQEKKILILLQCINYYYSEDNSNNKQKISYQFFETIYQILVAIDSRYREIIENEEYKSTSSHFFHLALEMENEYKDGAGYQETYLPQVLRLYQKATLLNPYQAQAHYHIAMIYTAQGNWKDALTRSDKAILYGKHYPAFYIARASLNLEIEQKAYLYLASEHHAYQLRALSDIDMAISLDPHNPEAYVIRGRIHVLMENWQAAISDYDNALAADPYHPRKASIKAMRTSALERLEREKAIANEKRKAEEKIEENKTLFERDRQLMYQAIEANLRSVSHYFNNAILTAKRCGSLQEMAVMLHYEYGLYLNHTSVFNDVSAKDCFDEALKHKEVLSIEMQAAIYHARAKTHGYRLGLNRESVHDYLRSLSLCSNQGVLNELKMMLNHNADDCNEEKNRYDDAIKMGEEDIRNLCKIDANFYRLFSAAQLETIIKGNSSLPGLIKAALDYEKKGAFYHAMKDYIACLRGQAGQIASARLLRIFRNNDSQHRNELDAVLKEIDKEELFSLIKKIHPVVNQVPFLFQCLDKRTALGKRFWTKDWSEFRELSLDKGLLKEICDHLIKINPAYKKIIDEDQMHLSSYRLLIEGDKSRDPDEARLSRKKNIDDALAFYHKAILMNPNNAEAHFKLAITYVEKQNYAEASLYFDKALECNYADPALYVHRAEMYIKQGCYSAALDDLNQAIALDPRNMQLYVKRGELQTSLQQWDEAFAGYEKALAMNPASVAIYLSRTALYQTLGKSDEAMQDCEKAIAINGSHRARIILGEMKQAQAAASMNTEEKAALLQAAKEYYEPMTDDILVADFHRARVFHHLLEIALLEGNNQKAWDYCINALDLYRSDKFTKENSKKSHQYLIQLFEMIQTNEQLLTVADQSVIICEMTKSFNNEQRVAYFIHCFNPGIALGKKMGAVEGQTVATLSPALRHLYNCIVILDEGYKMSLSPFVTDVTLNIDQNRLTRGYVGMTTFNKQIPATAEKIDSADVKKRKKNMKEQKKRDFNEEETQDHIHGL